jgi:hypothetical protein
LHEAALRAEGWLRQRAASGRRPTLRFGLRAFGAIERPRFAPNARLRRLSI